MSKRNNVVLLGIALVIVGLGILVSQIYPVKAEVGVPNTSDAKQIMAIMNRAYEVLGNASQTFNASEFPSIFIDTEDYKLTDQQQEVLAEILGVDVSEVKNVGYLTAMQVEYATKAHGAKLLQEAFQKAKAENRKLTSDEIQEIVKANHGQLPPGKSATTKKAVLTFESIEINGYKAVVKYDDGAALQEAILVRKQGKWFVASIVPIWVHY